MLTELSFGAQCSHIVLFGLAHTHDGSSAIATGVGTRVGWQLMKRATASRTPHTDGLTDGHQRETKRQKQGSEGVVHDAAKRWMIQERGHDGRMP